MIPSSLNTMMLGSDAILFNNAIPDICFSVLQRNPLATLCARICNAAGSVQQDIGFVNRVIDVSAINSFITANGAAQVFAWYNQNLTSSFPLLRSASPTYNRPIFNPSLYNRNGIPDIDYTPSNFQALLLYSSLSGAQTSFIVPNTGHVYWLVSRFKGPSTSMSMAFTAFGETSGAANHGIAARYMTNNNAGFGGYDGRSGEFSNSFVDGEFHSIMMRRIGGTNTFEGRKNGVIQTVTNASVSMRNAGIQGIGRYRTNNVANYCSGGVSEIIGFHTDIAQYVDGIDKEINTPWGL